MGSVSSRVFFKTLKSKVSARSSFVSGPILNGSCKAVPSGCDPKCGQRGGQSGSFSSSSSASCVAGAGRGAGLRPSGCSWRIMPKTLSSTCSSPGHGNFDRGAETRFSAGVARKSLATSRVAGSKIRSAWRAGAHGAGGFSGGDCFGRAGAVRRQIGESSRALKGQTCSRKSGDLSDRSAMSPLQVDSAFVSAFVPHARLFSLHPSLVSNNSCGAHGVGGMNSCGSMDGVVMHDNSFGVHVNSCGALGHRNSCHVHAAGV